MGGKVTLRTVVNLIRMVYVLIVCSLFEPVQTSSDAGSRREGVSGISKLVLHTRAAKQIRIPIVIM